jgi:hypothetical protein
LLELLHDLIGTVELLVVGQTFERLQDVRGSILGTSHFEQLIAIGRIVNALQVPLYVCRIR